MSHPLRWFALWAVIAMGGAVATALGPWVDIEQELGLPLLYRLRGEAAAPETVVIVAIDEASAQQLGVSDKPREWPRTLHAEMVRYLAQAGARVIVFDLTFDTPGPRPEHDAEFAAALAAAGNVFVSQSAHKDTQALDGAGGQGAATLVIDSTTLPIAAVAQAVAGYAPFLLPKAARVDAYWVVRNGAPELPTLQVVALRHYLRSGGTAGAGRSPPTLQGERFDQWLAEAASGGGTSFLNLYGPPRTLRTLSYARVMALARGDAGSAQREADGSSVFRGKAVFIGVSAATPAGQDRLRDDYRTVYSLDNGLNLSGVELAATAFANLLDERALQPSRPSLQLAIVGLWALWLAFVVGLLQPLLALAAACASALLYLGWAAERFAAAAWWPAIIPVGVQIPLALVASLLLRYRQTRRERAAIERAFGHFLPSAMVDQLARDLGTMTDANRVLFGSCLATDAGNYTALAERIDPGRLGQLMNDYFGELFVPVERSGGAVVDVVGDAMVAIWASSTPQADLRRSACEAALDIVARVDRFNRGLAAGLALPTRLGLHSGEMLVGNIGASQHYEYRAVGDIVNTASRLQGLNKVLGTQVLASTETVAGLDALATRPLGSFLLKGKATALSVAELRGLRVNESLAQRRLCEQFATALANYAAGQWRTAAEQLTQILVHSPEDGPSRYYLARCNELLAQPSQGPWQSTISVDSK